MIIALLNKRQSRSLFHNREFLRTPLELFDKISDIEKR